MGREWLTDDDKALIENYLAKPAHERRIDDLVPDVDDTSEGAKEGLQERA